MATATLQDRKAQNRNVIEARYHLVTVWALRSRAPQRKGPVLGLRLVENDGGLRPPGLLQHDWEPMNHDIKKAANEQAKYRNDDTRADRKGCLIEIERFKHWAVSAADRATHLEDRQVHRNHHAADHDTQESHDKGLNQRSQTINGNVDHVLIIGG